MRGVGHKEMVVEEQIRWKMHRYTTQFISKCSVLPWRCLGRGFEVHHTSLRQSKPSSTNQGGGFPFNTITWQASRWTTIGSETNPILHDHRIIYMTMNKTCDPRLCHGLQLPLEADYVPVARALHQAIVKSQQSWLAITCWPSECIFCLDSSVLLVSVPVSASTSISVCICINQYQY